MVKWCMKYTHTHLYSVTVMSPGADMCKVLWLWCLCVCHTHTQLTLCVCAQLLNPESKQWVWSFVFLEGAAAPEIEADLNPDGSMAAGAHSLFVLWCLAPVCLRSLASCTHAHTHMGRGGERGGRHRAVWVCKGHVSLWLIYVQLN